MNKEKQIKEIQEEIIRWGENADRTGNYGYALSEHLVDQGYRKIYDDNQRQCTCYALGCQMAEELECKVAREVCAEIGKRFESLLKMRPLPMWLRLGTGIGKCFLTEKN